jgi:hypothetical protein
VRLRKWRISGSETAGNMKFSVVNRAATGPRAASLKIESNSA